MANASQINAPAGAVGHVDMGAGASIAARAAAALRTLRGRRISTNDSDASLVAGGAR